MQNAISTLQSLLFHLIERNPEKMSIFAEEFIRLV